jgi:AraC-like DNA-binding protein
MILAVALVSIVFSVVIFFNNINRNSNYLAGFFLIIGIFNIAHYYVAIRFDPFWSAIFYNHFAPFYLLLGPFLFFYLRGIIEHHPIFKKSDWWHFIPFFVMLLTVGDYYFQPFEYKKQLMIEMTSNVVSFDEYKVNKLFPQSFNYLFRGTYFSLYLGYNFYLIFSRLIPNRIFHNFFRWGPTVNWIMIFHFVLLLITLSYSIFIINFIWNPLYLDFQEAKLILGVSSFGMVSMNAILLFFPQILYGITRTKESKVKIEEQVEEFQDEERNEYFSDLKRTIEELTVREQLFLLEEFSMEYLSKKLDIPIHHVRIVFKNYFQVRFTDYKNHVRVHHAIGLLQDNQNNALTIEAIGQNSGFSSRSTFFATFKKITGKTPLEYISR